MEQIANILGVSYRSFLRICQRQTEVGDAMNQGRDEAKQRVMQTAYQMAVSGKHPNMTMFYLKTQCKWREADKLDEPDSEVVVKLAYEPSKLPQTIDVKDESNEEEQ